MEISCRRIRGAVVSRRTPSFSLIEPRKSSGLIRTVHGIGYAFDTNGLV
jgi:hypothetical protein